MDRIRNVTLVFSFSQFNFHRHSTGTSAFTVEFPLLLDWGVILIIWKEIVFDFAFIYDVAVKFHKCTCEYMPGHAKTCLVPYANNKGADQPAHPRSLISTFVVRCWNSMIFILAISKVSRFELGEQAGLNLTWSKISEDRFSRDVAHMVTGEAICV